MDKNIYVSSGKNFGANKGGTDEWYTPVNAIEPLVQFIKPGSTIWCPFDIRESNYVKVFSRQFRVLFSHISMDGGDFFSITKDQLVEGGVSYIISNPPYSKRTEVIERLYELDFPFAMLCNSNGIFDNKKRWTCAKTNGAELLFMSPRVKFADSYEVEATTAPPHQSCYWCYKMLPEKLMLINI